MSLRAAGPLGDLTDPFHEADQLDSSAVARQSRTFAFGAAAWMPLTLALGAGFVACVVSLLMFPLLSENNDEAIYLLQADALRHGRLFPPAPDNWKAFLPALSVWTEGSYIPKYTPVHAGILAIGHALSGTPRGALALVAILATGTSYLLAKQILEGRRAALFAAACFAMCPLTIIQSATYLSYLSALALLQGFAAALLAGVRRESPRLLCVGGLLLGTAAFARPYEALLFATPFGMWLLWTNRGSFRRLARPAGWLAAGAVLPLALMLAFFHVSTGNWLKPPFNLLHSSDMVGFGRRQMYAGSRPTFYTPALAWFGMKEQLKLTSSWCFGGLALAGFAIAGVRKMDWSHPGRWLGLVAVTVPAGYFFFWGSYGSIRWGAPFRLGPFYYLPMLTPLTILGAAGFGRLWAGSRRLGVLALIGMTAFSAGTLTKAVRDNAPVSEGRRALYGPLLDTLPGNAIVFLPRLTGSSLLTHPFALARNDAAFSGGVVWALDRGPAANSRVLAEFPTRVPYLLRPAGRWRGPGQTPGEDFRTYLERLPMDTTGSGRRPPSAGTAAGVARRHG